MVYDNKEVIEQVIISIVGASIYSAFLGDNISVYKEALNNELYFNLDINCITTDNMRTLLPTTLFPLVDVFVFAFIYITYLLEVYDHNADRQNIFCLISLGFFPRLSLHFYFLIIKEELMYYHLIWVLGMLFIVLYSLWPFLVKKYSCLTG